MTSICVANESQEDRVREDRRRLVASRAFRRLAHKTQVIANPDNDHLGTRLTHTLEVAEIALSLSRGLDPRGELLDHHLVEVIALAHDVGHPPFGHAGEGVLARLGAEAGVGGFHHASFGVRLLSELERADDGGSIVRSSSVLEGVLAHSKGKSGAVFACESLGLQRRSSEALVVRAADLYAYASSDLDDAFRLGVFSRHELPALASRVLGTTGAAVRRTLVERTVAATLASPERGVHVDSETDEALASLRAFLYERFYEGEATVAQTRLARVVLERIFRACERGLGDFWRRLGRAETQLPTLRDGVEAIALMTDRFAIAFSGA